MDSFQHELIKVLKEINASIVDISSNIADTNRQLSGIKTDLDAIAAEPKYDFEISYELEKLNKTLNEFYSIANDRV